MIFLRRIPKMKKIAVKKDRWQAINYADNSEFQYSSAMDYLKQLPIKPDQKIVDVGCGSGKTTAELAKRVYAGEVTGIDLSKNMILYAREQYGHIKNVNFIEMDAEALQIGDHGLKPSSYDWVVSFWTLSWLNNPEKFISDMTRCLKEKGSIFLLVPLNNERLSTIFSVLREETAWKNYFSDYEPPKNKFYSGLYENLMEKNNFSAIRYVRETIERDFLDKISLMNFIRPWLAYLDPVPLELKDHFLKQFVERYLEKNEEDKFKMGFEVFTVQASYSPRQRLMENTAAGTSTEVKKTFSR